jgi:hypothetical protein
MTLSLIAALEDAALFAPLFPGRSWERWKAFIAALFGLPLAGDVLDLYRHHTGRVTPPAQQFREVALVIGRRGGKSRILALIAVYLATFRDYGPHLAPGEQPVIAIIAADRRQARIILRYVVGTLRAVPMLAALIDGEPLAETVRLTNGIVIEIHTGSIASPRGRTFIACLADEIAYWPATETSANPDAEVVASVRPGLASIPNSVLLMGSSPYWQRGILYQTFRRHWGQDGSRVLVWRGTTAEMNETIDPAVIAEAYEDDPVSAAAEYGAEFRTDLAAFVSREAVDAVTIPGRYELPPMDGITYQAFCDPSGGSSDSMTLAIGHEQNGIAILDAVREARSPFRPSDVTAEFAALLMSYRLKDVVGDKYGGAWPADAFLEHGISYIAAEHSKSDIYRELLPAINGGMVELLDHPRLIAQLCALERRTARGGRDSIDHPPGGHDDLANAVAGVLLDLSGGDAPRESRGAYMFARQQAEGVPAEEIGAASALLDHPESSVPGQLDYASASYRSELSEGQKAIVRFAPGRHGTRATGMASGPLARLPSRAARLPTHNRAGPIQWTNGPLAKPSVQPGSVEYERKLQEAER